MNTQHKSFVDGYSIPVIGTVVAGSSYLVNQGTEKVIAFACKYLPQSPGALVEKTMQTVQQLDNAQLAAIGSYLSTETAKTVAYYSGWGAVGMVGLWGARKIYLYGQQKMAENSQGNTFTRYSPFSAEKLHVDSET